MFILPKVPTRISTQQLGVFKLLLSSIQVYFDTFVVHQVGLALAIGGEQEDEVVVGKVLFIYMYIYEYKHINIYVYIYMYIYVYLYIHIYISMNVCVYM